MEQEFYKLDEQSNLYNLISKVLFIAAPILFFIVLLDTILFSNRVDRVLHYLDMIELISFFILAIFLRKKVNVHVCNKATSLTAIKNFSSALVYAVIGLLYILMCIQIVSLPSGNPTYYLFIGIGTLIFSVSQLLTGITYNKVMDKLLNQNVNEKKYNRILIASIVLNSIAVIVYLIGIIFFNDFDILSILRVILRTIAFILILLFETIYLKCFKKESDYNISFK